jgi:hypothetical protein
MIDNLSNKDTHIYISPISGNRRIVLPMMQ